MEFLIYSVINLICGVIVMIVHELPKAIAAHFLTHPLHKRNHIKWVKPAKYIDPIGLILFTVSGGVSMMGMGWQKPYEYNPNKLINKHKSLLPIMLTGQLSTLAFMAFMMPIWNMSFSIAMNPYITYFFRELVIFNFMLFLVNMLPVPPLDMGYMIFAYSPNTYFKLLQNKRYIHSAFILVVAIGILESFGATMLNFIFQIFL